jgi:hypothetical protein
VIRLGLVSLELIPSHLLSHIDTTMLFFVAFIRAMFSIINHFNSVQREAIGPEGGMMDNFAGLGQSVGN